MYEHLCGTGWKTVAWHIVLQGVSDHAMDGYLKALVASSDSDWNLQHHGTLKTWRQEQTGEQHALT